MSRSACELESGPPAGVVTGTGGAEGDTVAAFADGYAAGCEIGAARILLGLQHLIRDRSVLEGLPHLGTYRDLRAAIEADDGEPCRSWCRRCSRCIRSAAVDRNLRVYGTRDYPGGPAPPRNATGRGRDPAPGVRASASETL